MTDKRSDKIGPERLTRNWNELLQELRVVQTGVQILTGFLLTVPFTDRFTDLDDGQVLAYLLVFCGAVLTTAFVVAPVAFHRLLFRRRERRWLVEAGNWAARAGLVLLAVTSAGVLYLVFDIVVSTEVGFIAFGSALAFFALLWVLIPILAKDNDSERLAPEEHDAEAGHA